jgi:ANTAR domain
MSSGNEPSRAPGRCPSAVPVALTRTARGWSVVSPGGAQEAADLVEGLSLADLIAEEFGVLTEPDRTARRSARGTTGTPHDADPVDARVAALERTVAQLEHALAARVSTERAIGILAERHGTSARVAFEGLRRDARSSGRPVAELAREVLESLAAEPADDAGPAGPASVVAAVPTSAARTATHDPAGPAVVAADGRS